MEIKIFENYSDSTHIFGVCHKELDGLDRFGRTGSSIHREGLNKGQAVQWIKDFVEDGGNPDTFVVVASPRPVWETVEAARKV